MSYNNPDLTVVPRAITAWFFVFSLSLGTSLLILDPQVIDFYNQKETRGRSSAGDREFC
jgi:hypothetical protein